MIHRYRTAEHDGLASAWSRFAAEAGTPLPDAAAVAVAAPIGEDVLRFVNRSWTVDTHMVKRDLGVQTLTLLNDFGAVAHGVQALTPDEFIHIHGPEGLLPDTGMMTVLGPGTGLGVAMLLRREGCSHVIETEASHIAFAPQNREELLIADYLRSRHGRVSAERVVAGPGLIDIAQAMAAQDGDRCDITDAGALWTEALASKGSLAARALDRLVMALGSLSGDLALAHGSNAVVITGGLANRIVARLRSPLFLDRFVAKGRYRERMEGVQVKVARYAEPGLLGAAVAFKKDHFG
jgi:glucokinase